MPAAGGGGMAGYSLGELFLGILFWAATLALGLIVAGLVLIWFYDRLNLGAGRQVDRLNERIEALESRLNLYFQATGGYQEWARLKERERDLRGDD